MNSTHLFSIEWDDSYGDPDFAIPATFYKWLDKRSEKDRIRLSENLLFLARALIERKAPFNRDLKGSE